MISNLSKWKTEVNTASLGDGDSLAAYLTDAAGALLTSTLVGAKQSLDALDAADHVDGTAYAATTDYLASMGAVDNSGNWKPLNLDASGNLKTSTVVDFSYDYAEDSAAASGDMGAFVLAVRQDTLASSTSADGDYAAFKVDQKGELYVKDADAYTQLVAANSSLDAIEASVASIDTDLDTVISTLSSIDTSLNNIEASVASIDTDLDTVITNTGNTATNTLNTYNLLNGMAYAEDAAHASGDKGFQALAVRKDTFGTNTSANGDYASLLVWSEGSLKVVDHANSSVLQQRITLTTAGTAQLIPASALANRRSVLVQNVSDKSIFIGTSTVTTSGATTGVEIPAKASMEIDAGPDCALYAVCGSNSKNIVVLEMA